MARLSIATPQTRIWRAKEKQARQAFGIFPRECLANIGAQIAANQTKPLHAESLCKTGDVLSVHIRCRVSVGTAFDLACVTTSSQVGHNEIELVGQYLHHRPKDHPEFRPAVKQYWGFATTEAGIVHLYAL